MNAEVKLKKQIVQNKIDEAIKKHEFGCFSVLWIKHGEEQFLRKYCRGILVFTLGEKGSIAYDEQNRKYTTERFAAGKVIDTTGAGDSYIGAFMVAYFLRNYSLERSIRFASVCAGYTCTGLGARSGPASDKADELFGKA